MKIRLPLLALCTGLLVFTQTLQGQSSEPTGDAMEMVIVDEDDDSKYYWEVDPTKGFYDQEKQGWYFFEDPEKLTLEEEELEEQTGAGGGAKTKPFSSKWFRQNMQVLQDKAIDNPTEQNVRIYLIVQRVMMDKAQKFADIAHNVTFGDPLLDETRQRSMSSPGMKQQARTGRKNKKEILSKIARDSGIYFFTTADCALCYTQKTILKILEGSDGFTVRHVSLDGSELSEPEYLVDNGQAMSMGVDRAPALVFYNPEREYFRTLSQNTISLTDLRNRILIAAADAGVISDDEYASTRRIFTPEDLSAQLQDSPVDPVSNPDAFLSQFGGYRTSSKTYLPEQQQENAVLSVPAKGAGQ